MQNLHQKVNRRISWKQVFNSAILGGVVLLTSSCANNRQVAVNPFSKKAPAAESQQPSDKVEHAYAGHEKETDFIKLLEHKMSQPEERNVGASSQPQANSPTLKSDDPFLNASIQSANTKLIQVAADVPSTQQAPPAMPAQPTVQQENEFQRVAFETGSQDELQPAIELATAESPISSPSVAPDQVGMECPTCNVHSLAMTGTMSRPAYTSPEVVGDEYVHDGGDEGTKVYYDGSVRKGLDVEETVAEWVDEEGRTRVKASSRASVYAPRFASVRSASLPQTGVQIEKLAGNHDKQGFAGLDTHLAIDETVHNDEALAMLMRSRPSGLEVKATDDRIQQNQKASNHVKLMNVYEDFRFFRDGKVESMNSAIIGNAMASALEWNGDLGVTIFAHDQAGQEVQGRVTAQDYTTVEDHTSEGELTIRKVVDKNVAQPGDELTFTIRFDNVGDRELSGVRVVDNLSPRLVYIEGSVDSDLDGKLDTASNGRGSQILTFTFESPLQGHTGGWVSFKCRVR